MLTIDEIMKVLTSGELLAKQRILGRPDVSDADKRAAQAHVKKSATLRLALYEVSEHAKYQAYLTSLRELLEPVPMED